MSLPDPQASRAVLIGCDTYDTLESLPAVANNLAGFATLLRDPDLLGLPDTHCTVIANPAQTNDVLDAIHEAARAATDTLIVYFAGHGLLDERTSDLYLAMPSADHDRLHRAIRYDDIRRLVMDDTTSSSRVVILDCCYSGAALVGGMSGAPTAMADQAKIEGTYLLTASAETKLALAPVGERYTAFTGEILAALENGLPEGPDLLDLDTLYWHSRRELEAKGRPVPQQRVRNNGRSIAIARNRRGHRRDRPVVRRNLPAVPPGYESITTARPRDLVDLINSIDPATAGQILAAIGAHRIGQGVAAVIDVLATRNQPAAITTMLAGAAGRTPTDVATILNALSELDLRQPAAELLAVAAQQPTDEVAALAAHLHASGRDADLAALLDAAASGSHTAEDLIGLVGALAPIDIRAEVDRMLERNASRRPAADVVIIADALRGAGRDEAAFRFYAAGLDIVARRSAGEIASLLAMMRDSTIPTPQNELIEATIAHRSSPSARGELVAALVAAGLNASADRALADASTHFSAADVVELSEYLHAGQHSEIALGFCIGTGSLRGPLMCVALVEALVEAGRPIDANRILDEATIGWDSTRRADLVQALMESGAAAPIYRFLNGLAGSQPQEFVVVVQTLSGRDSAGTVNLLHSLSRHDVRRALHMAVLLRDRQRFASDEILADLVRHRPAGDLPAMVELMPPTSRLRGDLLAIAVAHSTDPGAALVALLPSVRTNPSWAQYIVEVAQEYPPDVIVKLMAVLDSVDQLTAFITAIAGGTRETSESSFSIRKRAAVSSVMAVLLALRAAGLDHKATQLLDSCAAQGDEVALGSLKIQLERAGHTADANHIAEALGGGPDPQHPSGKRFWKR